MSLYASPSFFSVIIDPVAIFLFWNDNWPHYKFSTIRMKAFNTQSTMHFSIISFYNWEGGQSYEGRYVIV
jgi:hypothetical protein